MVYTIKGFDYLGNPVTETILHDPDDPFVRLIEAWLRSKRSLRSPEKD